MQSGGGAREAALVGDGDRVTQVLQIHAVASPPSRDRATGVGRTTRRAWPTGFTLLEILIAVVLTSFIALIANSALYMSLGARDRVGRAMADAQRARATRDMLVDILRNTRSPQRRGDTTFVLSGDTLMFVAAGAGPPLDAECDWRVTIAPARGGLRFVATPVGRAPLAVVAFPLPGVTRMDVRVLAPGDAQWLDAWPATMVAPRAVVITLWDRARRVQPPIRVVFQ
ncbi:MAG TPA: prepilin-type N-terminal cleavage/methylation domain-containing protein [Gemmatimonadaceae bacterium]|nr:prepilin-type N-terminal cleavage/methylation domain-containing protein [Gemmatimonadaceae bacterium]